MQFSKNLRIKEIDKKSFQVFHNIDKYTFSIKSDYNEKRSSVSNTFFDINKETNLIGIFNEAISQMILTALTFSIKELIFENLPIKRNGLDDIFKKFKIEYEDNIDIVDIELDSTKYIKRVIIQIQLPKITHYIQQAYLRNFSSNNDVWKLNNQKEKARIFVFNKYKNLIETIGNTPVELKYGQKIKSIAKEDYFYSLAMEQLIRRVYETPTPPIFNKLIRNPRISILTDEEEEIIVDYILLTWQRTKEHRKNLEEYWVKMSKIFAEDYKGKKLAPNIKIEVNPKFLQRTHEEMMINFLAPKSNSHKKLSHRLLDLQWKIIKTKFPYSFLTSDNPVVFFNSYYEKEKKKRNDFINKQIENIKKYRNFDNWEGFIEIKGELGKAPMNKGVEIYLPISPTICLCLYDKETTKTLLTPHKINKEIILQADKYIFSHHKRLSFIKKIILKNPSCINKDGNRHEIRAFFKKILRQIKKQV